MGVAGAGLLVSSVSALRCSLARLKGASMDDWLFPGQNWMLASLAIILGLIIFSWWSHR
jgi:hypothetical protein